MYREATTLGAVVMSRLPDKPEETVATPTAGPWRGYYLLLERLSDDAWLVYWRNPAVPDERLSIGEDAGDDLLGTDEQAAAFLASNAVRWLSGAENRDVLQRFFSYRPPDNR